MKRKKTVLFLFWDTQGNIFECFLLFTNLQIPPLSKVILYEITPSLMEMAAPAWNILAYVYI